MYEDLVKKLRSHASSDYQDKCDCCEFTEDFPACIPCIRDMENKAADVIEKLEHQVFLADLACKSEAAKASRWIPVSERLPEEPYGCLLVVWDSPQNGGDDFLNYLPYFAGWDGEQWNDADGEQVPFEVVYWMPLQPMPEPPKEDSHE